jgi:cytochrome c biogenesis protein CcdA
MAPRLSGCSSDQGRSCVKPDTVVLLVLFALLAGAGTALSPCVLPVLPALLSAGATGGRRRPLGIVLGLAITFTVTIVGLAKVVDGVGLGDSVTRDLAIVALAVFGLAVALPRLGDRLEAPPAGWRGSARRAAAAVSGPGCSSARRWASSTRRARARSSPRSCPSALRPGAPSPSGSRTRSAPRSCC